MKTIQTTPPPVITKRKAGLGWVPYIALSVLAIAIWGGYELWSWLGWYTILLIVIILLIITIWQLMKMEKIKTPTFTTPSFNWKWFKSLLKIVGSIAVIILLWIYVPKLWHHHGYLSLEEGRNAIQAGRPYEWNRKCGKMYYLNPTTGQVTLDIVKEKDPELRYQVVAEHKSAFIKGHDSGLAGKYLITSNVDCILIVQTATND